MFTAIDRDTTIQAATEAARNRALEAGADEASLQVVEVENLPLAYLAGEARRVRVRAVGDVACVRTAAEGFKTERLPDGP